MVSGGGGMVVSVGGIVTVVTMVSDGGQAESSP